MHTKVIKNGTLITSAGVYKADVGIQGEKIASISNDLDGDETIDASGMLVVPGGVDPHVHLEMATKSTVTSDDWYSGTQAAAFGGTTTVIDFVELFQPKQLLMDAFNQRLDQAKGKANVDFGFHMTICAVDKSTLQQMQSVVNHGMPSFKFYTTYQGFKLNDEDLLNAFEAMNLVGALPLVHAESDAIIQKATHQLGPEMLTKISAFPGSRPAIAEKEAIDRVLSLAAYMRTPVYFVHVSTREGALAIENARKNGQAAWGETCPHYLILDDSNIKTSDFNGSKFVCNPPLRAPENLPALWTALHDGTLQAIGTDHCSFNFLGQKDLGKSSFLDIPPGLPGIELRLSLIYTFGVLRGLISLNQWIEVCCTNPARLFGIYPQKGDLIPGADADIVLFDPTHKIKVSKSILHEKVDYTPYEGLEITGIVNSTFLRGNRLVHNGEWYGNSESGRFIRGSKFLGEV